MSNMARPVIGVVGNHYLIDNQYPVQASGEMNIDALSKVCDAVALVVPSIPENSSPRELAEICDGFHFTGGFGHKKANFGPITTVFGLVWLFP